MNVAIVHQDKNIVALLEFILADCGYQVAWHCDNTAQVLQQCRLNHPDLLLIQNQLDGKNCSQLIKQIMQQVTTTVIVITESIDNNHASIFEAMSAGALDAIIEPHSDNTQLIYELRKKIQNIYSLQTGLAAKPTTTEKIRKNKPRNQIPLIAIGVSTGGPDALVKVLSSLPATLPASIVIIQHLDVQFSQGMAKWLNKEIKMNVKLAEAGETPEANTVYLAATNDHLILNSDSYFEYTVNPQAYPYRPSVDVFFESILKYWSNNILAILLTGMGRDGADGLLSLHRQGIKTIAQDESSCAVFGMPKAAIENKAVEEICPLGDISNKILEFIEKGF